MDRTEFETRSLEHLDALYRMAMQLTRHPDEASDLVQETYLKALRAADRFEERGGGIRPWLFKILHNVFYSRVAKARRTVTSVAELTEAEANQRGPDEPGPAWDLASFDWEHVDGRLKEAIERLRPDYRAVLLLWGVEGLKYREIAEIVDVPIGTVMSRLHRARSTLVAQLQDLIEESGAPGG
ncbi:MAG: sigma-70 family RNA polymerase sigma factor [Planctomycetota bacterium]